MVRYVSIYDGRGDTRRMKGAVQFAAVVSFLTGLLMVALVYLAGEWAAEKLFQKPALREALYWLVISIPFECLMRVFLSATRGLKQMHFTALIENWTWICLRLLFTVIFITGLGLELKGAFMAFWISSVASAALAFVAASRVIPLLDQSVKPLFEAREILKFSLPMLFTALIYDLMSHLDVLMLGLFVSATNVGIYSVAVRILQFGQVFFMAFQPIFQSYVAELHDKKEFERLGRLLKALTHWSVMLSLPVFLSLLIFPAFFLHFFGNEFLIGADALSILVVAFMFSAISNLPATMIFMAGRSDLSLINNVTVLVLNATLNYLFIPRFGIVGAAVATGISFVFLCVLRIVQVYRMMGAQPFRIDIWKPFAAGFASIGVVILIRSTGILVGHAVSYILLGFFFIVYLTLIFVLKLDEEQIYIGRMIWDKLLSFAR